MSFAFYKEGSIEHLLLRIAVALEHIAGNNSTQTSESNLIELSRHEPVHKQVALCLAIREADGLRCSMPEDHSTDETGAEGHYFSIAFPHGGEMDDCPVGDK